MLRWRHAAFPVESFATNDRAGDGGNIHDTPIVRFKHEGQNGFRDVESGLEVDRNAVIQSFSGSSASGNELVSVGLPI